MNAGKKTARQSKNDIARQFLWHFAVDGFEHEHWWREEETIDRLAALWEVRRRHPECSEFNKREHSSPLEWYIRLHGLKCWKSLTKDDQRNWIEVLSVEPLTRTGGIDVRPVVSLTILSADIASGAPPDAALTLDSALVKKASEEPSSHEAAIFERATKVRCMEIARLAQEHHRRGRVLISIEPDISNAELAAKALAACYNAHRVPDRRRCRAERWLAVIREFEVSEIWRGPKHKRDSALFTRYRRVISDDKAPGC